MNDPKTVERDALRTIVRELAECDPTVDDPYGSRICVLCGAFEHRDGPHHADCVWFRAQTVVDTCDGDDCDCAGNPDCAAWE